jgi:hypothetical protein
LSCGDQGVGGVVLPPFCGFASVVAGGIVPVPVVVVVSVVAGGIAVDISADVLPVSLAGIVPVLSAGAAAGAVVSVAADPSAAFSARLQAVRIRSAAAVARIFFMFVSRS